MAAHLSKLFVASEVLLLSQGLVQIDNQVENMTIVARRAVASISPDCRKIAEQIHVLELSRISYLFCEHVILQNIICVRKSYIQC